VGVASRTTVELRQRINAATERAAPKYIADTFGEHGYDPLVSLAVTSVTTTDLGLRSLCDKEIANYYYAKRKSVEVAGPDGQEIEVKVDLVNTILGVLGTRVGAKVSEAVEAPPSRDRSPGGSGG
jgi:hypothetical protein